MYQYISVIKESFSFFPVVALFFTIPYMLVNYHKYGSIFSLRVLIVYSLILYLMTVYFLVILPLPSIEVVAKMTGPKWQPIPFVFIQDIIKEVRKTEVNPLVSKALLQFIFNVLMVTPFGMYLHYYFECDFKKTLKYSFLLSLFFELTQLSSLYFIYPRPYRLFDADDLMANTLGGAIGYFAIVPFLKFLPTRKQIDDYNIKMSKKVSFLRRGTAFGIDMAIIIVVNFIMLLNFDAVRDNTIPYLMGSMIVYFLLIPFVTNGFTPGTYFVRIRVVSKKGKSSRIQVVLRYLFMYLCYFRMPLLLAKCANYISNNLVEIEYKLYSYATAGIIFAIFVIVEFVLVLFGRQILAERLSKTELISTIKTYEI